MDCLTCKSLKGEISLTPGPVILSGKYWQVEHAYPVGLKGWLVIVLKRHVEALHELSEEENIELKNIQSKLIIALHQELNTQKEYLMCFAEKEGFNHVHFHLVGIPHDLLSNVRGAHIFSLIGKKDKTITEDEIIDLCNKLITRLKD